VEIVGHASQGRRALVAEDRQIRAHYPQAYQAD
jgi:hypothetical protein